MQCTSEEIAEKKRLALERLKQRNQATDNKAGGGNNNNVSSASTALKTTSGFYGNASSSKAAALDNYENKMKHSPSRAVSNRILSQPYSARAPKPADTTKIASVFTNVVTCSCQMVAATRFEVNINGFLQQLIAVFKTIPSKNYSM